MTIDLPPERLAKLFRKYSGAAVSEHGGETGGSGLGLAICKGLIEAHGGRIRAKSGGPDLGAGAPSQRCEFDRILVVDDDPQTLLNVRDTLAEAGYSPLVNDDHGKLEHIIRTEKPALVLFNLMLPRTDGIELMQKVTELAYQMVIFISGLRPQRDHRARARGGRRRLHRQALLADRTDGANPGGIAPARRPRADHAGHHCH